MEISKVFATYIVRFCQLSLLIVQHHPTTIEWIGNHQGKPAKMARYH